MTSVQFAGGKPHFCFRDLDENHPLASIRIRAETMHYFLQHYQERIQKTELWAMGAGP